MVKPSEIRLKILVFLAKDGQRHVSHVANAVGMSNDSARHHLMILAVDGFVEKIQISERVILWKITEAGLKQVKHKK